MSMEGTPDREVGRGSETSKKNMDYWRELCRDLYATDLFYFPEMKLPVAVWGTPVQQARVLGAVRLLLCVQAGLLILPRANEAVSILNLR